MKKKIWLFIIFLASVCFIFVARMEKGDHISNEVHALEFTEEEYDNYQHVHNDNVLEDYIANHPDFTIENINAFELDPKYGDIRKEVLRVLLANHYQSSLPEYMELPPIPELDVELITAIDFLNGVIE